MHWLNMADGYLHAMVTDPQQQHKVNQVGSTLPIMQWNKWDWVNLPLASHQNLPLSKYHTCIFMHYVSLVKVQKTTPQDSLDKAVELFYWTIFTAMVSTQSSLPVTSTLEIVLPLGKMLVSGVMVSDDYNIFANFAHILHLFVLVCGICSTVKEFLESDIMHNGLCSLWMCSTNYFSHFIVS